MMQKWFVRIAVIVSTLLYAQLIRKLILLAVS